MSQENGKVVQPSTVSKHLFTALSQGRSLNLRKLAAAQPPPSRTQWEQLTDAEAAIGKSVVEENVNMTTLLEPVLPEAVVPWAERTEEQKATVTRRVLKRGLSPLSAAPSHPGLHRLTSTRAHAALGSSRGGTLWPSGTSRFGAPLSSRSLRAATSGRSSVDGRG